ncbi:MAG TPA: glycosyl transferase [Thermoanaerobaculia bacterium]|nr:glycosyl transferase [Thermoanaerobaculia bacterium]
MISPVLLAFAAAVVITPLVRAFARKVGAVAAPKKDRWHQKPTAMMGGVAIFAATMIALLTLGTKPAEGWVVIVASSALFVLGLVDDFLHLKPYQKLIGQLLAASTVIYFGLVLPWTGSSVLNMAITFFWLVGVTNAVNMLDNMDGLSAGVAAIAAVSLGVNFMLNGQMAEALMLWAFGAALGGFLVYNHNPASIFMGDCGSLFVGFFLASTALLSASSGGGRSRSVVAVLAVPVLVLCIPIFDTTFVTLMRKLAGRAASRGGRDHTSHRLVALGLSERHAVWMLYAFAILGGALAVSVRHFDLDVAMAAIVGFAIFLGIVGVYLGGVHVYSEEEVAAAQKKPVVSFLIDLSYKRRVFEVLLDGALIVLAHYVTYALVFGPARAASPDWQLFLKTLPAIVAVKLAAFLAVGVYRGMWRYAGVSDAIVFGKAVFLGSLASLLMVVFAFRFVGFSRTVFVLDALLLTAFLVSSRFAFRLLRRFVPAPHERTGRRALIYGAGDGGELLYRELRNNPALNFVAVGFIDDDARKAGKLMHGLRVHDGTMPIEEICRRTNADALLFSTEKISMHRVREIVDACGPVSVAVHRMRIELQQVTDSDLGWVLASPAAEQVIGDVPVRATLIHATSAKDAAPQATAVLPTR